MKAKNYLATYRTLFALLGFSAIVTEIAVLTERGVFAPENFFSFFTIESNILAVVSLLLGGLFAFAKIKSRKLDFFRGAVTLYMVVTGIVFAVLLSGLENAQLTAVPWDNIVLHYIMPIVIALDWFMDPPKKRFTMKKAMLWLAFPIAYLGYSLIRGPIVEWYPYPFLDPTNGGYGQIAITSVAIAVLGILLVTVITRFPSKRAK
jgi:hypothetical protein